MQQVKDFIGGVVRRGKRWDMDKKAYVNAKFFNVIVYERDKDGNPIQIGTREFKNEKGKMETVPKYKIATILRLPESTLVKVAAGEAKSCLMFWKPRQ